MIQGAASKPGIVQRIAKLLDSELIRSRDNIDEDSEILTIFVSFLEVLNHYSTDGTLKRVLWHFEEGCMVLFLRY